MTTSQDITNISESPISRGDMAYVCARNQSREHSALLRTVKESGLSQKELAMRAGIDESTVSRILARPSNLEINTLSRLVYAACSGFVDVTVYHAPKHSFGFAGGGVATSFSAMGTNVNNGTVYLGACRTVSTSANLQNFSSLSASTGTSDLLIPIEPINPLEKSYA